MKTNGARRTRQRGFTLIELLVVVAIIALLISILLPSLQRAREQAKIVSCSARLHDISISLMSYANDFGRLPPQNSIGNTSDSPDPATDRDQRVAGGFWSYAVHEALAMHMGGLEYNADLTEHTRTNPVFYCPYAPPEEITNSDILCGPGTGNPIETTEDRYLHISYVYVANLNECANDPAKPADKGGVWRGVPAYIEEPARSEVEWKRKHYVGPRQGADEVLMLDTVMAWQGGNSWRINHGAGWDTPISTFPPKLDGANIMYGDGHVESKKQNYFAEMFMGKTTGQAVQGASLKFGRDYIWW